MLNKIVKKVYEQNQKREKFWSEVVIHSGRRDNTNEIDAAIELINKTGDRISDYIPDEDYVLIRLYLDAQTYIQEFYKEFQKLPDGDEDDKFNDYVKNNLNVLIFYTLLDIRNPLEDRVKNLQRFMCLYKYNNLPNEDIGGFYIPYVLFLIAEQFTKIVKECLVIEENLKMSSKKNQQ